MKRQVAEPTALQVNYAGMLVEGKRPGEALLMCMFPGEECKEDGRDRKGGGSTGDKRGNGLVSGTNGEREMHSARKHRKGESWWLKYSHERIISLVIEAPHEQVFQHLCINITTL